MWTINLIYDGAGVMGEQEHYWNIPPTSNKQFNLKLHSFIQAETDLEQDTLIVFVISVMFDLLVGGMGL